MGNDPSTVVSLRGAEATFTLGADDDAETVENFDVVVRLPDGSRWSASLLTLAEIGRLMDRWRGTGECLGGAFFQSADLVILRRGGVPAATRLLQQLVDAGEIPVTLAELDADD